MLCTNIYLVTLVLIVEYWGESEYSTVKEWLNKWFYPQDRTVYSDKGAFLDQMLVRFLRLFRLGLIHGRILKKPSFSKNPVKSV